MKNLFDRIQKLHWILQLLIIFFILVFFGGIISIILPSSRSTEKDTIVTTSTTPKQNITSTQPVTPTNIPTPIVVSSRDLVEAYDKNKLAAQEQYTGKAVQTTAYIDNISTDVTGNYYLSLRPTSDKYYFGTDISCYFADKSQKAEILALENEQSVTVQGKMADMSLGIVVINDCQIVDDKIQMQQGQISAPKTVEKKSIGISMEQFNRIQEGMTYQEAVSILGSSGEVISSSDISGYKTVMYMWKGNSLGANMNAMFQNDKLISKAQFGL